METPDAFELLKLEMKLDEVHLKVNAIHRLKTVMASMEKDRLVAMLVPYINELIEN